MASKEVLEIDLMISRIDNYLTNYNEEVFILDDVNYISFFDVGETGYKAIVIEKDNYDIPSEAGTIVTSFKSIELALLDLTIRLLIDRGI